MEYGLIGEKLGHSYSPMIHERLGGYDYILKEIAPADLPAFMQAKDFKGLNVTIPYKQAVIPFLSELSPVAEEIGCVNTIIKRADGTLIGHNTDIGGFMGMLKKAGIDPANKKAVILGSGGTSLTARTALRHMGAKEIVIVSRKGPVDYETLYRDHADAEILVNTTPVGMYPKNGICPADLSRLPALKGVADVVYNPEKTALILEAEALGIPCISGLPMLVGQAREAAEWFMGETIDPEKEVGILAAIRMQTRNLVLVGMPGCGKTTIGKMLAEKLGREYVDSDAEIVNRAGMPIPEIFAKYGEKYFRDLESEVIADLCKGSGKIIATGGGAILRDENVRAMRQNGRTCLMLRPIDRLPTEGRPLSSASEDAVKKLWEARKDKYAAAADLTVENLGTMEETVRAIMDAFTDAARTF
ncbi:MAG: AAA family ATPase [Clostridia bacterium]|nr:AAA family ATPase [Clostridia bacterium]